MIGLMTVIKRGFIDYKMKIYKVGIIGFGYWGPNIVRNFNIDC